MTLTIVPATGQLLEQWRAVHNGVVRPVQLTAQEVVERAVRNHLTVAYVDGILVSNATIRPPQDGGVTVIVRILSEHRHHGFGSEYLRAMVKQARTSQVERINTVVPSDNAEGLAFAIRHGFVETKHYELGGVAFVELTLRDATVPAPIDSRNVLDR